MGLHHEQVEGIAALALCRRHAIDVAASQDVAARLGTLVGERSEPVPVGCPVDLCCLERGEHLADRIHERRMHAARQRDGVDVVPDAARALHHRIELRVGDPGCQSLVSKGDSGHIGRVGVVSRAPAGGSSGTSPCRSPRARRPRAQAAATATDRARPTHRACALRSVRCQQPCRPRSLRGPRVLALRSPSPSRWPRCQRRTSSEQASGRLRRDVGRGMHLSTLDQLRSGGQRRIEHEPPGREWALPLCVTSEPSRGRAALLARLVHRLLPSCRAPKRLESGSGL